MYNTSCPHIPDHDIPLILKNIEDVLRNNKLLTMGDHVKEFERKFSAHAGTKYAVATNSCTSALEDSLKSVNVKNKEVIVPVQTFIATGLSIVNAGGTPIFADINDDYNISYESVKKKLTPLTKAVIIVHYAGLISDDIFKIKDLCKKNKIYLIEDCAHATASSLNGLCAGSIGDIGCFSFYATKIITSGEGGMIVTDDKDIYQKCASHRSRGIDINSHEELFINPGSNHHMTEVNAIIGLSQLDRLKEFAAHRRRIANIYDKELSNLEKEGLIRIIRSRNKKNIHSYWRYLVKLKNSNRAEIQKKLLKKEIKIDWAYYPPLHQQPVFEKMYGKKFLPNSETLMKKHACLPVHTKISENAARFIACEFINSIKETVR